MFYRRPRGRLRAFFYYKGTHMNIYIYSDESGVFDKAHNQIFVFGGLLFLSKTDRDIASRKYINVENTIRGIERMPLTDEVKASSISNKSKSKIYRSLNKYEKFGIVIHQDKLLDRIFGDKKSKQRYLDWAFKIAIKAKFHSLIKAGIINPDDVENLYFFVDEHTTATNGRYELEETLEQEFKLGTYNYDWSIAHAPIFTKLQSVSVQYCDSSTKPLVRAADIIANHIYHAAIENSGTVTETNSLLISYHPYRTVG